MAEEIRVVTRTDVGRVSKQNEDYAAMFHWQQWTLLVLCDGMGGVKGGQIASRLAVETMGEYFKRGIEEPETFFREAVALANRVVRKRAEQQPELAGMGTTAVMLLHDGEKAYHAHVGDSRLYLYRGGKLQLLTRDHSYVGELVQRGLIDPEEAHTHPERNKITRCIGVLNSEPEIAPEPIPLQPGDIFLLCSDGLTDMVPEVQIGEILFREKEPEAAAEALIREANRRGGRDNITVQLLKVPEAVRPAATPRQTARRKRPHLARFSLTLLLMFIVGFLLGYQIHQFSRQMRTPVEQQATLAASSPPRTASERDEPFNATTFLFTPRSPFTVPASWVRDTLFSFSYVVPGDSCITCLAIDSGWQVVVSLGLPSMPNLEGRTVLRAVDSLAQLGFAPDTLRQDSLIFRFLPASPCTCQLPARSMVYATFPANRRLLTPRDSLILVIGEMPLEKEASDSVMNPEDQTPFTEDGGK